MKTRQLQRDLNAFTSKYLKKVTPLRVDGKMGPATKKRIREVKYYLGYTQENRRNASIDEGFLDRLHYPNSKGKYPGSSLTRARQRRARQRKKATAPPPKTGVGTFDGKPVANGAIPHMKWAREVGHGGVKWKGQLVSGYRTPAYSEHLCYAMCGRPSCPGRCAGRSTNHSQASATNFAVDVSDYTTFGRLMRSSPHKPKIWNALGARDPVHFSPSGR